MPEPFPSTESSTKSTLHAWAMLFVILVLFACRNLPWHLDDFDQAKQAFTSFEMVKEGHWWFQHTPVGRIATKPPLAGWISAILYSGTGWWEGAWRLPSLLGAALILVLLRKKGDALLPNGGMIAMAAFGFTVFTPRIASLVRTDMLLTACIFLTGYLILDKVRSGLPWTRRERWQIFATLLASMMIKGPIGYAFLLPGVLGYTFFCRRFEIKNAVWSGSWSWFAPLLFFAAWAGIGIWLSPEFYEQVVQREFLGRFSTGENAVHQPRNPFFYMGLIALRWQPWSVILMLMAFAKPVRAAFRRDPELLWLVCWSLGGLLLMSAVPSKRFDRILPVIPPLCLLLVAMVRHLQQSEWRGYGIHKLASWAVAAAFVISVSYAGHDVIQNYRTHQRALVHFGGQVRAMVGSEPLAVVSGKDEGMLLYTDQTAFTRINDAVDSWQSGQLNWIVLPEKILKEKDPQFAPYQRLIQTGKIPDKSNAYVLIGRLKSAK
ncbi:MAG: dolichyl-phosphate-mannose-mannosyltransferase family protein [Chthoniobacteraceae bacterium]|nr:dolichyl-phosphate-mannose-mannosyltransferase family protein [Chthoniobacteraceae bacterium]